ncbi:MFS transporter [Anaerobacillus alkalilacustris]|uniref:MFS transporter n=1 Tax=Anaerobacillus alkalilacustris TaxID=393763 RepID=A0A1S2LRB2_9BACI|nr:MFS transporter [Anaerobacillus alkalilacustris]OIJ14663.1 MFS transporter [Anaerobacillus alkalilacustris]
MWHWLRVPKEKRLSRQAIITLSNHGIFQFGNSLSNIFVNLYLWRLTNDLWINGAYNLITLLAAPLATILIGKIAKQKDRLIIYRLGIFLTAIFYLCILLAMERMVDYFYLFALLKGVSTSFYWLGHFTLMYDFSTNNNRHRYLGFNMIVNNISQLTGPALAGLIIGIWADLTGYGIVFGLAFVMFFVASIGSLRMEKAPTHHKTYYLKYTFQMLRKYRNFSRSLAGWYIIGLPQGIMMYVPAILMFNVFGREDIIGLMNIVFFSLTIMSSYLVSRYASIEKTGLYMLLAAIGFSLGSTLLLWEIAVWSVVIFMVIHHVFNPLHSNTYTAHYYQMMDELPLNKNFRIESIVVRETAINLGRATSVIIVMLTIQNVYASFLPWLLFIMMILQFNLQWAVKRVKKIDSKTSLKQAR